MAEPDPAWEIREGDCRDLLRELPDQSVSAVCTDPPYELGFMGRAWDSSGIAYDPRVWREVLRVLKPGAHLVAFGGTRTAHRLVCAIEDAGAEIRDSLVWLYGSGFPKSRDVGKAIDSEAGAEREVVGTKLGQPGYSLAQNDTEQHSRAAYGKFTGPEVECSVTAPATDAAARWEGWGTALKPGHEPICLARKPLEGTVAGNVLAYCTGALNVDGCRVGTDWQEPDRPESWKRSGNSAKPGVDKIAAPPGAGIDCHPGGRWPPNVLLTHSADCRRVGAREGPGWHVATGKDCSGANGHNAFGDGIGGRSTSAQAESVPVYDCAPGCPVAELGAQSGDCSSGSMAAGTRRASRGGYTGPMPEQTGAATVGDTGTAARFYPQTEWTEPDFWPFAYHAKASRAERDKGCRNTWPTVKPLELMRWLVRLVTPPGGLVLDPFVGSGSTLIAAGLEGFRGLGFEQDPEALAIATARIKHCLGQGKAPPVREAPGAQERRQRELFG